MAKSHLEARMALIMLGARMPKAVQEYRFHETRKWRFDFAYPELKIAIEVEGGTWAAGRHTTGAGFDKDCEKYNAATRMGWRILRYTAKSMKNVVSDYNELTRI